MNYLFTSESVSEGHPDKVADQISDAILDEFLRQDPESKVACETFCSTGLVLVGGEVRSEAYVDIQKTVRDTIRRIGYTKAEYRFDANSCGVLSDIHEQSGDINRGVVRQNPEEQGAGDQGMMFGYACHDTEEYMPLPLYLSQLTLRILGDIRHNHSELMPYLRPDSKCQYTIEYDEDNHPLRVHTLVLSTQHDEFAAGEFSNMSYQEACAKFGAEKADEAMHSKIEEDVRNILIPMVKAALSEDAAALFLTGRKIIVDTYGGRASNGGGAFSGKDPSKVDRSAAYATRYIAKNMVAAGIADEMLIQVAYAIGVAEPVSIFVNTHGTACSDSPLLQGLSATEADAVIASKITELFDLRPSAIIKKFDLKNPIYEPTAAYGHFGRKPYAKSVKLIRDGKEIEKEIQFFGWEKLDAISKIRLAFGLK